MTDIVELDKERAARKDRAAKLCFTNEGYTAEELDEINRYHRTRDAAQDMVDWVESADLIYRNNVAHLIVDVARAADLNTDGLLVHLTRHLPPTPLDGPDHNPGIG